MGDDVGGVAVHIAARVSQKANASEVLVSSTVKDLVAGAGLNFVEQGPAELKGLSESICLFSAVLVAQPHVRFRGKAGLLDSRA